MAFDAAILKVNSRSARVRILGETGEITFRSQDIWDIVPGHLVTLVIEKRWVWKGDEYASGAIENPRIAIEKLDLTRSRCMAVTLRTCDLVTSPTASPILTRRSGAHSPRILVAPLTWTPSPGANFQEQASRRISRARRQSLPALAIMRAPANS